MLDQCRGLRSPSGGTIRALRGGCWEEADDQLYGDYPTWFRARAIATNAMSLYASDIVEDGRFRRALVAWAGCMRQAGHPYSDPAEIRAWRDRIDGTMRPDEIQAVEVDVAVATCARDTPLLDTARALERVPDPTARSYQDDVATYQRMGLTALSRAETITGATP